jgi:hypothetical protein
MTPDQILSKLETFDAEIRLTRSTELYMEPNNWHFSFKFSHKASRLETSASGPSREEAILAAWAKLEPLINTLTFTKVFEVPLLTLDQPKGPEGSEF